MHRAKTLRLAFFALLALTLGACGGGIFREPKITLENVQVGGLGLSGGTLVAHLRVQNPNGFSLTTETLKYQLAIRNPAAQGDTLWLDFADGTYDQPFTVRGGETKDLQVPVEFSYSGLGGASSALLRNGTFTYRATGTVDVRTPIGVRTVPFQKRGTFTLLGTR